MTWATFFKPQTLLLEETKNDVSGKPVFTLEFETLFDSNELQQTKKTILAARRKKFASIVFCRKI